MKINRPAIASLLLIAGLASANDNSVFTPASEVQFNEIIPDVVSFATVAGDRKNGAHGTFVRVMPGQATPPHTHSAGYHAVVLEGKFENPVEGDRHSEITLTKGSYYYIPAGAKHVTRCAADSAVACLTFFYQDVPFDFTTVE